MTDIFAVTNTELLGEAQVCTVRAIVTLGFEIMSRAVSETYPVWSHPWTYRAIDEYVSKYLGYGREGRKGGSIQGRSVVCLYTSLASASSTHILTAAPIEQTMIVKYNFSGCFHL